MLRMTRALDIDVSNSGSCLKNRILSHLYTNTQGIVAFPILEGLSALTVPIWQKLASIQAIISFRIPVVVTTGCFNSAFSEDPLIGQCCFS